MPQRDHSVESLKDSEKGSTSEGLLSNKPVDRHSELTELRQRFQYRSYWILHLFFGSLILFFGVRYLTYQPELWCLRPSENIYDDIRGIIEYQTLVFHQRGTGIPDPLEWNGDPDLGSWDNWKSLVDVKYINISEAEVSRIPEGSKAISPSNFAVIPQVFHDLHCLTGFKKYLWGGLAGMDMNTRKHLDHCLNAMRQNAMCEGNLQPIVVHETEDGEPFSDSTTRHKCRNWEKIHGWARGRKADVEF